MNGDEMTGFVDGERAVLSHEDAGDLITRVAARIGLSIEEAADLIAEIQEASGPSESRTAPAAHLERMVRRGVRVVLRSRTNRELAVKLWCFALAMRWYDVIDGIDSCTGLAAKLKLTKADINKFACMFRDIVPDGMASLPASNAHRPEATRGRFGRIRFKQETERMSRARSASAHPGHAVTGQPSRPATTVGG